MSEEETKEQDATKSNKGYGFVCYKNPDDARAALQAFTDAKEAALAIEADQNEKAAKERAADAEV